jgi:putative transposase
MHQWNDGGLAGLLPDYGGGRPPKLPEEEVPVFLECVERRQPVTIDTIESILRTEFGVEYAAEYLPRKLEEIGLTYRPPARERVDREAVRDAVEWDEKESIESTRRHPYNEQSSRTEAGWVVLE